MDDRLPEELRRHFERTVGRPPAGLRERTLAALHEPHHRSHREVRWLPAIAALVLAALLVAVLILGREAAHRRTIPASTPTPTAPPLSVSGAPPARDRPAVAYDEARHRLVMFGGKIPSGQPQQFQIVQGTVSDETWTWDGTRWARMNPGAVPPARTGALAAYDAGRREVVMFGGGRGVTLQNNEFADTWTWDGRTWTQQRPAVSPPSPDAYTPAVMGYDPASRAVLLYEVAVGKPRRPSQTWRWADGEWTQLSPATSPDLANPTLISDGKRLLMTGEQGNPPAPPALTVWTWTGADWSRLSSVAQPALATPVATAYDPATRRLVAIVLTSGGRSETWTWDGANWARQAPTHQPTGPYLASFSDPRSGRAVLYRSGSGPASGPDQAWSWTGSDWEPALGQVS